MSSRVVLDASFVVSMVTSQPTSRITRSLWGQWKADGVGLYAPSFLLLEVGTGIQKYGASNMMSARNTEDAFAVFQDLVAHMSLAPLQEVIAGAWDVARRYNLMNLYDASYVALADQLGCHLWTLEAKMKRVMPGHAEKINVISAGA